MKKKLLILVSVLLLAIPGAANALGINKTELELKKGNTETLTISDKEENQTVEWSSNAKGIATVDENGKVTAVSKGDATITATVKDSDGNTVSGGTFTCKVTVTEEEAAPVEEKVDLTIKGASISGATIEKADDSNFNVNVTSTDKFKTAIKDLDKNLKLELADKKTSVAIGSVDGKNQFVVVVTYGNEKKAYTFKINYPASNTYLSKLEVAGYAFDQAFNKDTTNYTVTIPYDVTTVTINANPEDDNAKVSPNVSFTKDNLQVGGNTVTIKVTNGSDSRTYKVYITRSEEEAVEENATSIISSKNTSSGSDFDIPDTENPDSPLSIIIITLGSLVLCSIGVIGIYFYVKTSPKRMKKELLKKKQDKEESPIVVTEEPKKEESHNIEEL